MIKIINYFRFNFGINNKLNEDEREGVGDILHLRPTCASTSECNIKELSQLAKTARPNIIVQQQKKVFEEDADGLATEILLANGTKIVITHTSNLCTSKSMYKIF